MSETHLDLSSADVRAVARSVRRVLADEYFDCSVDDVDLARRLLEDGADGIKLQTIFLIGALTEIEEDLDEQDRTPEPAEELFGDADALVGLAEELLSTEGTVGDLVAALLGAR